MPNNSQTAPEEELKPLRTVELPGLSFAEYKDEVTIALSPNMPTLHITREYWERISRPLLPEGGGRAELERAIRICDNIERTHRNVDERIDIVITLLRKRIEELPPEGGEGELKELIDSLAARLIALGEYTPSKKIIEELWIGFDALRDFLLSRPSPGEGVGEEVRKVGEQIFLGNNVYGKCKTCGAGVHLRDGDIPVKTLWPFKDIIAILSRHLPKKG